MADACVVFGVGRRPRSDDEYRTFAVESLEAAGVPPDRAKAWCGARLHYQAVSDGGYEGLAARIEHLETREALPGNRVFYLALPPSVVPEAVDGLGAAGLLEAPGWVRLVVEKPFGRDAASAAALDARIHRYLPESAVYRIDHYLGKETVQNLIVFRFANPFFERAWNRDDLESVEITVAEDTGIGSRAPYYDEAGVVRDMVQNHLTQVLTLIAMEPPISFAADDIRDEKVKVLRAIDPVTPATAVLGQYTAGTVRGEAVPGYLEEPGVQPESATPTFAALRLTIDNWRWHGVPFYLRTGKRLPTRTTRIVATFRHPPVCLFGPGEGCEIHSNRLIVTLQPDEGFDLWFDVKAPGSSLAVDPQRLRFSYRDVYGDLPDAYVTLLRDVIEGDQTLFVRSDEVTEAWRIYEPILDRGPVHPYPAGTWGPLQAASIPGRDGRTWWQAD